MSSALALDLALPPTVHRAPPSPVSGAPRTDRHWERSSECRGALRFCAMAETFTMTEGEEAARWGMGRRIFAKSKLARGPASSHVAMLPSTNCPVRGCERHLCSYRWPADSELTVSEDRDRPTVISHTPPFPLRDRARPRRATCHGYHTRERGGRGDNSWYKLLQTNDRERETPAEIGKGQKCPTICLDAEASNHSVRAPCFVTGALST